MNKNPREEKEKEKRKLLVCRATKSKFSNTFTKKQSTYISKYNKTYLRLPKYCIK